MRGLTWRLVERWLTRRVPARAIDGVLRDLEDEYLARLESRRAGTRSVPGRDGKVPAGTQAAGTRSVPPAPRRGAKFVPRRIPANLWLLREARSVASAYRPTGGTTPHRHAIRGTAMLQDASYALRLFRRRPGLTAAAMLTLALGLGANLTVFAVARAALFPTLPYPDADRIVSVYRSRIGEQADMNNSAGIFRAWQAAGRESFIAVAAHHPAGVTLSGGGLEAVRLSAIRTTPELFDVMGVRPLLGRPLSAADAQSGLRSVVISHDLWRTTFGADPGILGRAIQLDGEPWSVVGVMPARVTLPSSGPVSAWLPLVLPEALWQNTRASFLDVTGRLRPQASIEAVEATLISATVAADANTEFMPRLVGFLEARTASAVRLVQALQAIAAVILVIAAVNIANLLLAATCSPARQRELALRASLGASRGRLARQLFTESLLLAGAGAAVGLVLAAWLGPTLVSAYPGGLPAFQAIGVGWREGLAAFGLVLVTTAGISLAPVVTGLRVDLRESLAGATPAASPVRARLVRGGLIGCQAALAVLLIVGGGLLARSYWAMTSQATGFDPGRSIVGEISLPDARYPTAESQRAVVDALSARLRAAPGVEAVGAASLLPFDLSSAGGGVDVDLGNGETLRVSTRRQVVAGDYFRAVGVPLRGRAFDDSDTGSAPAVAIVNETFARRIDPSGDVIGARFRGLSADAPWVTIVGVAADVLPAYRWDVRPEVSVPLGQEAYGSLTLVVRPADGAAALTAVQLRQTIQAVDPDLPIYGVRTYAALIAASVARDRFNAMTLTTMGTLATLLAVVGIAGVTGYVVRLRAREIGIRVALGARAWPLQRLIVGQGLRPIVLGLGVGLVAAWWLSSVLEAELFGIQPRDVLTFVVAPMLFLVVGVVACWWPVARAVRVDPLAVLRDNG